MAWTSPLTWVASSTLTSATLNTHIRDNLKFLKGTDGTITIEDALISDTDKTDDLGSTSVRFRASYVVDVWANRYKVSPNIREVRLTWPSVKVQDHQVTVTTAGSQATALGGGFGQIVMSVNLSSSGNVSVSQMTATNTAFAESFVGTRNPYFRAEIAVPALLNTASSTLWIGFRETVGNAVPATNENAIGFLKIGTAWYARHGPGSPTGTYTSSLGVPATGTRHVLEMKLRTGVSGTMAEYWTDGTLGTTTSTLLPTGTLYYQMLLISAGGGANTALQLTVGQIIAQEIV